LSACHAPCAPSACLQTAMMKFPFHILTHRVALTHAIVMVRLSRAICCHVLIPPFPLPITSSLPHRMAAMADALSGIGNIGFLRLIVICGERALCMMCLRRSNPDVSSTRTEWSTDTKCILQPGKLSTRFIASKLSTRVPRSTHSTPRCNTFAHTRMLPPPRRPPSPCSSPLFPAGWWSWPMSDRLCFKSICCCC
jgi:hypothetical protein